MGPSFGAVNGTSLAGAPLLSSSSRTPLLIVSHLPRQPTELSPANAARFAGLPQLLQSSKYFSCRRGGTGARDSSSSDNNRSNRWSSALIHHSIPWNQFGSCCPCSATNSGLPNLWNFLVTIKPSGARGKMEHANSRARSFDARIGSDDGDFLTHGSIFRTRKVVEHIALFKMKDSLTEEQEKDMLDNLWTLQYRVRNVIFTTVGRLVQKTPEGYTHGLLSRFPSREALAEFLESAIRWSVSQDYIYPYYEGNLFVDFEADVEDDMEPLFRRGEDFQEGFEQLMLFKLRNGVPVDAQDEFLKVANALPEKYHDLVQLTAGFNLSSESNNAFSHGLVARLLSEEAYLEFEKCLQIDASWARVMELFDTSKTLVATYIVSPVGKTIM